MLALGRWNPAQGMINAFCLFVGIRGLIEGPLLSGALFVMLNQVEWAIDSFYCALIGAAVIAMTGEILRLKLPLIEMQPEGIGKLHSALVIEFAGMFLISLALLSFSMSILFYPLITPSRAIPYVFLGLGALGRSTQCLFDLWRIRRRYVFHKS